MNKTKKAQHKLVKIEVDFSRGEIRFIRNVYNTDSLRDCNTYWLDDFDAARFIAPLVNSGKYVVEVTASKLVIFNNL